MVFLFSFLFCGRRVYYLWFWLHLHLKFAEMGEILVSSVKWYLLDWGQNKRYLHAIFSFGEFYRVRHSSKHWSYINWHLWYWNKLMENLSGLFLLQLWTSHMPFLIIPFHCFLFFFCLNLVLSKSKPIKMLHKEHLYR